MPDWLPKAGHTSFDYDDELRLEGVTDAEGQTSKLHRDELGASSRPSAPTSPDSRSSTASSTT